jgi:pyridoxamine 5'-phosphate oxidase
VIPDRNFIEARLIEAREKFADRAVTRPDTWGGWCIVPVTIEFWQGRPSRLHDRFIYSRDKNNSQWQIERLAP